jgi:photosystem II stability/assembly factor-like uncharacterized protein
MTVEPSQRASSRSRRKEEAQRKARNRARKRLAIRAGAVLGGALVVVLVGLWWLGRSDGSEVTAGQALHQFDTADFHSLAFAPDDPDTLYFGHHNGLQVSHDGGASWQDGTLSGFDAMQQSIPVADPSRHYIAGHDVFQVSTDGGESWQSQANDLPGLDIHGFAAAPSDPERLYAFEIISAGLFTSADGGATWEPVSLPPGLATGILPLAVAYDDPLHVYAGVGEQVMESLDGGQNWQPLAGPGGAVISIATSPADPGVLLAGTDQGLWQRGASGAWGRLSLSPEGAVLAVAVHPEQPEVIAAIDQQGNFYRSADGGATWVQE